MTTDSEQGRPALSAAALSEWNGHVESILRGVAHALNNRAAALSAVIELTREPQEESTVIGSILGTELERVGELVTAIRMIAASKHIVEAFVPAEAAADAVSVLKLHADQRDRRVAIETSDAPPVRAQRWMFVRALIALGAAAGRKSTDARLQVTADGDWAVVRVDGPLTTGPGATAYVTELARAMGGEPLENGYGFRVPTLAAVRRREGRAG